MKHLPLSLVATLSMTALCWAPGCVSNPAMSSSATTVPATSAASAPVRASTKKRNTRQGQQDYLMDHKTANTLCSSQSYQQTYQETVNRAQTSAAISQVAYSIGAYIPGASMLSGLGSAVGSIAASQAQQAPQFDHASCVDKYMRERGW